MNDAQAKELGLQQALKMTPVHDRHPHGEDIGLTNLQSLTLGEALNLFALGHTGLATDGPYDSTVRWLTDHRNL